MTKEIKIALDHVRKSHPTVSMVVFNKQGQWQYMDEDFGSFVFGDEIDISILEDASDSVTVLPCIYQE